MKWKKINALILCGLFIVIDIAFFGANIIKIMDGGWVPIAISIAIVTLMTTWRKGRYILELRLFHKTIPLEKFINKLQAEAHHVAPGTAIYLNGNIEKTPYALFHTYQHFKTIHERLIFLSVVTKEIPFVSSKEQIRVVKLHDNVYAVTVNFGYLESQDVPKAIDKIKLDEYVINADEVLYFLGKEKIFATKLVGMTLWREKIFSFLNHNALDATRHFNLPPKQVTEIGVQVEI
jgi:KUP system potassium uptake protein